MARHQSHVAWGNSTSSLPIPLLSSSVEQSSICKAAPAPVGRQSQDGGTFDPQGLAQKRNYFQLTRPAYGNVYEWLSRDWESPPGSHSALGSVKRFDEYPVPSTTSLHLSNNDRTFQSPQEKDLAGRPDHGCSYEAICTPNMVQQGGPRELLPPIDLSDRSSSEDFGPSYKDYSAPGNLQRDALSPTETSCEGLCIFSDDSEHGLSCEDQFQPVRWLSFSSSNGYPGQTLDFTLEGCRITSPRRRLSYGEHLQTPESKSLDGTAGSRELRRALSSVAKTDDYARSKNQTLKGRDTTDRPQTTQPQNEHVPPQHTGSQLIRDNLGKSGSQMESSSTKSTLWSSPDHAHQVDDQFWTYSAPVEGQIKDAQYTTLTSPKPRVVTITPRSSSSPTKTKTPEHHPGLISPSNPYTPPKTPHPLQNQKQKRRPLQNLLSYPLTPPSSRFITPGCKETVRRIQTVSSDDVSLRLTPSAGISAATANLQHAISADPFISNISQSIEWVLIELERSTADFPASRLQLSSPCIQRLRLSYSEIQPPVVPKAPSVKARHNSFSTFNHLGSSHPPNSLNTSPPSETTDPPAHPTLPALRTIFSDALPNRLESLQATYIALNYVSAIHRNPSSIPATSPDFQAIPRKACEMLGIQPYEPLAGSPVTFGLYTTEWNEERVGNLTISLRILVRGLLGEIEGRRLGKKDEPLVRAVGELVRMGESTAGGQGRSGQVVIGLVGSGEVGTDMAGGPGKKKKKKARRARTFFEEL